jgi:protein-disulfide isomerase
MGFATFAGLSGSFVSTSAFVLLLSTSLSRGACPSNGGPSEVTKDVPEVKLDGVDTSSLTPREKKEWSSYVSRLPSPCQGAGASVAQCIQEKKTCAACVPAAKFLVKAVRDGATDEIAEKTYRNRFEPSKIKEVKLDDSPSKGPEGAAITFVEFADFECPHCSYMAPVIKKAFTERKANMRVIYKFMPLPGHPNGETAARAGIAAIKQGKFWEMHDTLFANQGKNSKSEVDGYAKELGLNMDKFRADFESPETKDRLERDRKLADVLEVHGTPTIFVNGRLYESGANAEQSLVDWLNTELIMRGAEVPKPSLMPTASAAPTGALTGAPTGSVPAATTTAIPSALPSASASVRGAPSAKPGKP